MIQPIRALALPLPYDMQADPPGDRQCAEEPAREVVDVALDQLLKHALKTTAQEPDFSGVWQRLAKRVCGPFGAAALESPTLSSLEADLLFSGGRMQTAPFVLSDRAKKRPRERPTAIDCLCEVLHFNSNARAQATSVLLLA